MLLPPLKSGFVDASSLDLQQRPKFNLRLHIAENDAITLGRDPQAKKLNKAAFVVKHPRVASALWSQRSANKDDIIMLHERFREVEPNVDVEIVKAKIQFIEHHRSHLASAFYPSPLERCHV